MSRFVWRWHRLLGPLLTWTLRLRRSPGMTGRGGVLVPHKTSRNVGWAKPRSGVPTIFAGPPRGHASLCPPYLASSRIARASLRACALRAPRAPSTMLRTVPLPRCAGEDRHDRVAPSGSAACGMRRRWRRTRPSSPVERGRGTAEGGGEGALHRACSIVAALGHAEPGFDRCAWARGLAALPTLRLLGLTREGRGVAGAERTPAGLGRSRGGIGRSSGARRDDFRHSAFTLRTPGHLAVAPRIPPETSPVTRGLSPISGSRPPLRWAMSHSRS